MLVLAPFHGRTVERATIPSWCLLENVSEELTHALFVTLLFKVHISHETLRLGISIGTLEEHAQVFKRAYVTLTDINNKTRVGLLLNRDFTTFLLGPNFDTWLRNINPFLI